jgi:hypothetical protein
MEENFFKLLEYEQKLEKTGEYLSLEKEKELLNYQSQISDHFRWKKKNNFIKAMVDFLEDRIDFNQYIDRFYEIDSQVEESKEKLKSDFEKLRAFEPNPRSKGFAILIENLFSDIRILEPDDELRTEDEISEKSLRDGIKEFLLKIQEY